MARCPGPLHAGPAHPGGPETCSLPADDMTLDRLSAVMPVFLPDHRILPLPAWDSLPYDRVRPSRAINRNTRCVAGVVGRTP